MSPRVSYVTTFCCLHFSVKNTLELQFCCLCFLDPSEWLLGSMETANDGKYQLIYMNVCWTAHFVCTRVSWRCVRLDVEVKYRADQTTDMALQCCF